MTAIGLRKRPLYVSGPRLRVRIPGDALAIFALAVGVRILFSLLMAGTYDKDEFVYLALGRDVGNGVVPYRDFPFFHPPGILRLVGLLNPLTVRWWPSARLTDVLIDSMTSVLVWRIAKQLYSRRAALTAGVLYSISPVVLVSAIRVDQEVSITALGAAGTALLVCSRSRSPALLAGASLALACWIKYPIGVFLPVYLLLSPRRAAYTLLGFFGAGVLLLIPDANHLRTLYHDSVAWQLFYRTHTAPSVRLETIGLFWLLLNPFAVAALLTRRNPLWLTVGFATGAVYLVTASVYSHYFVPLAPYAAVLGAPVASRLLRLSRPAIIALSAVLVAATSLVIQDTSQPFVINTRFSSIAPIVQALRRTTSPGTPVFSNQFEFAYLASRPWIAHYFWDDHTMVASLSIERRLSQGVVSILYPYTDYLSYPPGLHDYLDDRYIPYKFDHATIWLPTARDVTLVQSGVAAETVRGSASRHARRNVEQWVSGP